MSIISNLSIHQSTPPVGLDTWGLDPSDYRFHSNVMRRYPSPLYRYSLGSSFQKLKKVFLEKKNLPVLHEL